jgi:transcriptional regulator with GAF, ATPase, and Fis domain
VRFLQQLVGDLDAEWWRRLARPRRAGGASWQRVSTGKLVVVVGDVRGQVPDGQEFSALLGSVARELLAEPDVQQTLQRAVELAAEHLTSGDRNGEVYASVSLVRERRQIETAASSDERATRADQLQYELKQGPCLDAIWEHETFQIQDLTTDQRYPEWSRRVVQDTGIRSSLSFQLFASGDSLGALNLYSPEVAGFNEEDRVEGLMFAAHAAVALKSAQTEEQLRSAITTRTLIGQAQGILMERYKIPPDRAFEVLRRVSQHVHVKLRALHLVETGETPGR